MKEDWGNLFGLVVKGIKAVAHIDKSMDVLAVPKLSTSL
jgi:hypothetical protein